MKEIINIKKIIPVLLSLLLLISAAFGYLDDAFAETEINTSLLPEGKLSSSGDPDFALSWFTKVAENGDIDAAGTSLIELGYSYLLGDEAAGIQENPATALRFFEKAEELGVYSANNILGIFFTYGSVVKQDPDRALEIYLEGARAGYSECEDAIEQYAYSYYSGNDFLIDINFHTAFQYYEALMEFDNPRAKYNLGMLYLFGLGVSPDLEKAEQLISQSADAGFPLAQEKLPSLFPTSSDSIS